ncbi:hypothetical protein FRC0448_00439 [Corynebacterium diphtheriae]|nr:hypothetical protein FRC0306_00516 [Corynebacterium diphtheriae]CAB0940356.1 hypothetical protein FRC0448_00439 [Corynebacterium diphtheriae]
MQPTRKSWKNMTVGSVERPEKHSYPQPHITGSTRRRGRRNLGVFINIGGIFMNTTACFAHTDMNDPFSRHLIRLNQAEVDFWLSVEPDKFRDFHTQIDEIATRMSLSEGVRCFVCEALIQKEFH